MSETHPADRNAIFPMAGWLYLNYGNIKGRKSLKFNVPATVVILFSIALGIAYVVVIGGARTLVDGKISKADQAVCRQSIGKPALYIGIDAQTLRWHTIPDVTCDDVQP